MTSDSPAPPFFRGQEYAGDCDFLLPSGDACDAAVRYDVWWIPVPSMDLDTKPISGACGDHVVFVDRRLVERMTTHHEAVGPTREDTKA